MCLKNKFLAFLFILSNVGVSAFQPAKGLQIHKVIQGGKIATEKSKSWRSVVRLYISGDYTCTGTFIGYRKILTAAHCLKDRHLTSVTFFKGGDYYSNVPLEKAEQRIKLNHLFSSGQYSEDMAMVYLNKNIMPSGYYPMNIVTSADISDFSDLIGKTAYMIGASRNKMGTLAFAKGVIENTYSSIDVKGERARAGICGGDSGGPLVIDNGRELILLGVLAGYHMSYNKEAGDDCTEGGHYAPYTSWAYDYFNETES